MSEPERRMFLYPVVTNRQAKIPLILPRLTLHFDGRKQSLQIYFTAATVFANSGHGHDEFSHRMTKPTF